MLKIRRKENESVYLILPDGMEIIITLGHKKSRETLLSISAPKDVLILREELVKNN